MKQYCILACVIALGVAKVSCSEDVPIALLKSRIAECRQSLSSGFPSRGELLADSRAGGLAQASSFLEMREVLTNHWSNVVANLSDVATNDVERLVILVAGVAHTSVEYTNRVDVLADSALSGEVSQQELKYYMGCCGRENPQIGDILVTDYREPSVSNLIMKLNGAGALSCGVTFIFSGEARLVHEAYDDAHR